MQISATIIAAQQAAREARARIETASEPAAGFANALQDEGFAPLPLKQAAVPSGAPQAAPGPNPAPGARPGSLLDIKI